MTPTATETTHEVANAKAQLLKDGTYDSLVGAIKILLEEKAENLSHALVKNKIEAQINKPTVKLTEVKTPSSATHVAKNKQNIFKQEDVFSKEYHESIFNANLNTQTLSPLPPILDNQRYFTQCGVGLNLSESTELYLSVKTFLNNTKNIGFCRFWGKILGLQKNYYIIETTEIEIQAPAFPGQAAHDDAASETASRNSLPISTYKPPVQIQSEFKAGPNRFVYYACNELNGSWTQLPDVKPDEILMARKITKYFTGNLEASLDCFPNFLGLEKNYLRAQIARISASTIIAPNGRMRPAGDEEDEEEDEENALMNGELVEAENYEIIPAVQLLELDNWVHIRQALSKNQARTSYWKPPKEPKNRNQLGDDEDEDEEEEEEDDEVGEEIEEPIPILREISLDGKNEEEESNEEEGEANALWNKRLSSKIIKHALVLMKSSLWPGAYTFAKNERFESIYVGYGQKFSVENFSPEKIPEFQVEADLKMEQKDCAEMTDPTVEEETQLREQMAKDDEAEDDEDEEEGEEEGEEEEDED